MSQPRDTGASETTPLLVSSSESNGHLPSPVTKSDIPPTDGQVAGQQHDEAEPASSKAFPYGQILILCYTSLAEPVAYFGIFPFINEMINLIGEVPVKRIGFYAGLIESLFSLVQMLLMIFYGRAADRYGRKPVLVFSLTGIALGTAVFGLTQSLWQMILARSLAGVFAGSVLTVRTMLAELTTKETQGKAFAWFMFTRNMGISLGPVIGGLLVKPAEQFSGVFGGVAFWEKFPYALSTFVCGGMVLSSALLSLVSLKETLQRKKAGHAAAEPPLSTMEVIRSPGVPMVLTIYAHTMFLAFVYTAVSPVYQYTFVEFGGFGFSDQQIALTLAVIGVSQAVWTLVVFPWMQKKYGTGFVMQLGSMGWPLFMLAWPVLSWVLRNGWMTVFWIAFIATLVLGSSVAMTFVCCQLFVNDVSPSPSVLATLNAVVLTMTSALRSFAPILGTSLYAAGLQSGFAHGQLIWFFLVPLAAALNIPLYFLPEAAYGRPIESADTLEDESEEA